MRPTPLAILTCAALAACADAEGTSSDTSDAGVEACIPREATDLIALDAWEVVTADADPLADHRPEEVVCPSPAELLETGVMEIDTEFCNYFSVSQPLLEDVRPCERLQAVFTHEPLTNDEPAEAHVALLIGGELVWEEALRIPQPSNVLSPEWEVTEAIPAGTPIVVHLHNHGVNNYRLLSVRRLAE